MPQKVSYHPSLANSLPLEVKQLFAIFLNKGDELRLVGGCVRDLLIKKPVNDFDFATTLLPEDIISILKAHNIQAIPTGIKFGTITAVVNRKNFEITTLRKDLETDGRHCAPEFVDDYLLDAQRRDFTINAFYLDDKGNVTDYFDGIEDLKKAQVKFIGDAKQRVQEDYLRILRFFRFSCDYAKTLDAEGFAVCVAERKNIKTLSKERIRAEFLKLISSEKKDNLLSILRRIEPDIAAEIFSTPLKTQDLEKLFELEETLHFKADVNVKIAALFVGQIENLKAFCLQLCATNKEKKYLQFMLQRRAQAMGFDEVKVMLAFHDKKLVKDLYLLHLLQCEDDECEAKMKFLERFILPEFPLNGEDMKQLGFKKKQIGEALNKAKQMWALRGFVSSKDDLVGCLEEEVAFK